MLEYKNLNMKLFLIFEAILKWKLPVSLSDDGGSSLSHIHIITFTCFQPDTQVN